jgi:hypothetical protein
MANLGGQIGEESFDWCSADTGGADVRMANCKGQLGSESFDWSAVDLGGADVRRANLKGSTIDEKTFEGVDLAGADVRAPNVPGVIGDEAFNELLRQKQTPVSTTQSLWRLAAFPLSAAPLLLVKPAMAAAPERYGLKYVAGAAVALAAASCVKSLVSKILMVKSGTLTFAQYAENGTTQVLQAGIHLGASLGTTTRTARPPRPRRSLLFRPSDSSPVAVRHEGGPDAVRHDERRARAAGLRRARHRERQARAAAAGAAPDERAQLRAAGVRGHQRAADRQRAAQPHPRAAVGARARDAQQAARHPRRRAPLHLLARLRVAVHRERQPQRHLERPGLDRADPAGLRRLRDAVEARDAARRRAPFRERSLVRIRPGEEPDAGQRVAERRHLARAHRAELHRPTWPSRT